VKILYAGQNRRSLDCARDDKVRIHCSRDDNEAL
jgi:hypothetical protein